MAGGLRLSTWVTPCDMMRSTCSSTRGYLPFGRCCFAVAGKQRLMPFFNRSNNPDLILAIQSAGVSRGRNGFRKDKSGEKLAESEEDLLEHRTDGSDAFDTLYIGGEKFPHHEMGIISSYGIM